MKCPVLPPILSLWTRFEALVGWVDEEAFVVSSLLSSQLPTMSVHLDFYLL